MSSPAENNAEEAPAHARRRGKGGGHDASTALSRSITKSPRSHKLIRIGSRRHPIGVDDVRQENEVATSDAHNRNDPKHQRVIEEKDGAQDGNDGDEDDNADNDDDAQSCTSNQTEDGDENEQENDLDGDEIEATSIENDPSLDHEANNDPPVAIGLSPKGSPSTRDPKTTPASNRPDAVHPLPRQSSTRLPAVLSVTINSEPKKVVQEPRPPRGSTGSAIIGGLSSQGSRVEKRTRHKFQFADAELMNLVMEEQDAVGSMPSPSMASRSTPRRRFSSTSTVLMSTTLPLRRQSFSLTKSPLKPLGVPLSAGSGVAIDAPSPAKSRLKARRKSTSTCYSGRGLKSPLPRKSSSASMSASPHAVAAAAAAAAAAANLPPPAPSSSSQIVLRVRERKSDGIPELVISKRPARTLVWQWNDRQIRIPFMIQLGPHQHGIMLRQLRYVKSVMNDFPWAKTHLKELLAAYTKKDMSKEELYPQLNLLSLQVQQEIGTQVKKQRQLAVKKQHLTMQLSLATSILNEIQLKKYGRLGKPHETKLCYDPGQPTRLRWVRKNGEQSTEALEVDEITIHCYSATVGAGSAMSLGMKKALKKFPTLVTPDTCLSLVAPSRTLDLQLKSALHRDWLVNALQDVIGFARQYKAVGAARREAASHNPHILRRM